MTKKEIVKKISDEKGLTQLAVKEIVQMTFDAIVETLINDPKHRIELRNFGVFEVKKRAARTARNPRTGDAVEVPAKFVVTFKPGKEMEEKVLELERAEADRVAAAKAAQQLGTQTGSVGTTTPQPGSTYGNPQQSGPTSSPAPFSGSNADNGEYRGQSAAPQQSNSWSKQTPD